MIIVSGPSGAGKGTVIRGALALRPEWRFAVSATTRAPREGEADGIDYRFMSDDEFSEIERDGGFLETEEYAGARYGTLRSEIEDPLTVVEIDVRGAAALRPYARTTVFLAPPSLEQLEARLRARSTESDERIAERLSRAEAETARSGEYAHVIVNDRVSDAVERLVTVLDDRPDRDDRRDGRISGSSERP